jgi:hypothetical protein
MLDRDFKCIHFHKIVYHSIGQFIEEQLNLLHSLDDLSSLINDQKMFECLFYLYNKHTHWCFYICVCTIDACIPDAVTAPKNGFN